MPIMPGCLTHANSSKQIHGSCSMKWLGASLSALGAPPVLRSLHKVDHSTVAMRGFRRARVDLPQPDRR